MGGSAEGFGCFYTGGAGAAYRLFATGTAALGAVLVFAGPVVLVLAAIAVGFALHSVGLAEIFFGFVLIAFGTRGMSAAFVYESSYSRVAVIGGSGVYRHRECAGKQSQHCEDFDKAFHRTKVVFFFVWPGICVAITESKITLPLLYAPYFMYFCSQIISA